MDTETAKEECSMHYALLLYSRLRKKYNKQYIWSKITILLYFLVSSV